MTLARKRVIAGAVVLGMLLAGLFVARLARTPARASTTNGDVTTTIAIDSVVGETFAPPPSSAQTSLTAQDAWAQYAALAGSSVTTIPSTVTVQLGLLTLPVGPASAPGTSGLTTSNGEAYTALNELAYGYSWHSCPVIMLPGASVSPGNPCIEWLFLDANTGQQIDETWQQ
jgi:hypothetical protein